MRNFYIYRFDYKEKTKSISSTIIFCDNTVINESALVSEIGAFYENCSQTDRIVIIGGEYLKDRMIEVFIKQVDITFKRVPKRQETSLSKSLHIYTFDASGKLNHIHGNPGEITSNFYKNFLNEGLQHIFIKRGGLVETEGSHHYVFPSGKHCDKFLRTGNILLFSSEIYFIAFALMKYYDSNKHNQIYCDTSSINSIAIALSELKNRFLETKIAIPIESFSSYNGLYNNDLSYKNNALLLISASTSGNILNYITAKHNQIDRANIIVLFFLDIKGNYTDIQDNVLCNLTYTAHNPKGINTYNSYEEKNCQLCKNGSHPVEVSGDVFLLEKPKINSVLIGIKDADENLSKFVQEFRSQKKSNSILKVNYKESAQKHPKYDIYIDYSELLNGLNNNRYPNYKKKLDAYVNQFVPSNLRFVIHLNDKSSLELSDYILEKIIGNYSQEYQPNKISQDEITQIPRDAVGAVLVVGSCISNGKNLLYLSRALRNYQGLRVVYFVGISRMGNSEALAGLKTNLKQGNFGPETSTYIEVEKIFCTNVSKNNNWQQEIEFLSTMINLLNDQGSKYSKSVEFFKTRKKAIEQSYSDSIKGLSTNLFFPKLKKALNEEMEIRNNFAFFDFDGYVNEVTQSDIYFTFNNVINSLRNSKKIEKSLVQTSFVRNLLSPNNFNRFNDGIIQASILRSAVPGELSYSIDFGLSLEMKNLLETIIKYHDGDQGEAILEFLYAIAIGKLSFKEDHLNEILELLKSKKKYQILECFVLFIEKEIIEKNKKQ